MLVRTIGSLCGCALVCSSGLVRADHPSTVLGVGLAQPVTTISAIPMPAGSVGVGVRSEYINNDDFSDGELAHLAEEHPGEDIHSVDAVWTTSLGLAYGVTDNLMLGARLPYVSRRDVSEPPHHDDEGGDHGHDDDHHDEEAGVEKLGDIEGFGDAVFFGQYRFYRRSATHVSALLGVKAPTGEDNEKSPEGERVEAELQPGSGSWDGLFGMAVSRSVGNVSFDASVLYQLVTEGSQDTDLGDGVFYNAAVSFRLHGGDHHAGGDHIDWDLMLEANGEWREREEVNGVRNPNSGGSVLFLSPGIRANAPGGWNFSLAAGVPVSKAYDGIQSEPSWRVIGSLGMAF